MTKLLRLLLCILVVGGSTGVQAQVSNQAQNVWQGHGYQCYDAAGRLIDYPAEKIRIYLDKGRIIARKITGDPCVTAGQITWYVEIGADAAVEYGKPYEAAVQGGVPERPNSAWDSATVIFDSASRIRLLIDDTVITFTRP